MGFYRFHLGLGSGLLHLAVGDFVGLSVGLFRDFTIVGVMCDEESTIALILGFLGLKVFVGVSFEVFDLFVELEGSVAGHEGELSVGLERVRDFIVDWVFVTGQTVPVVFVHS